MPTEHEKPHPQVSDELRDKAFRLFTYLKEVCALRFVVVRDCKNYEKLWLNDIPHEPECHCIAWNGPTESNDSWIEVRRSPEPACPPVPNVCKDWLSLSDLANSAQTPALRERILAPAREGEPPSYVELSHQPNVRARWEGYLAAKWESWAKEHRRWKSVQQIYGTLFTIYQQQKRLGESFELRIGLGLLSWQTPTGDRIYRHILAGRANINFDATRGVISVSAAGDGVKLVLEHDMLDPSQLPTPEQHQGVEDGVQANAETPWDRNLIEPLLQRWVHAMNERGRYDNSLQPPASASSIPQITFSPALILRRRTAKTLVKLLADIAKNFAHGGKIPFGVQRLCQIVDDVAPDACVEPSRETNTIPLADTETYFPLPANEEQSKIAQRLSTGRGVLVQGPPGTGKSHTIANLICHLLAKGKRVLVTSQTPRALKVLQDKIPKELSALCVSILGNDTTALENMENSVLGITARHHDWQAGGKERNAQHIRQLEERLYAGRSRLAEIETRLRQLRELQTYRHSIAGGTYQGTAAQIAQKVVVDREHFGWLPDSIGETHEIPLPALSFLTCLQLLRSLHPARCVELNRPFVAIADLPDVDAFVRIAAGERAAKGVCQTHSAREASSAFRILVRCGRAERGTALEKLLTLQTPVGNIRRRPLPWIPDAIHGVLSDQDRPWRQLLLATATALVNLCERARQAHERQVHLPDQADRAQVLGDAWDLYEHLNNGGSLGFLFFRPAVVRRTFYITTEIRVNGRACANKESLAGLIEHLDLEIHVERLWGHWTGLANRIAGPLPRQVAELEECHEALELVVGLIPFLDEAKAAVNTLRGVSQPAWHDDDSVGGLIADLEATAARDALAEFDAQLSPVGLTLSCAEIRPNAHPVNVALTKAVLNRNTQAYSDAWNELRQLTEDKQRLDNRETIFQAIKKHAPRLAAMLVGDSANPQWDDRFTSIEQSWNWSRANAWLHEFHRGQNAEQFEAEAKTLQKNLQRGMAEVAAEKAWRHCCENLAKNAGHREHLMAWTQAMRRIGRGTGARAEIHRRNAREHMDQCRDAVPAWIMPFYRLAETIDAKPESFDVVIVDEASQSGPDALALLYLAKQIIVVGDDQQISPEAVGVERAAVDLLSDRLISDLPHRDSLGVESSLFNQAEIRFGGRIILNEHFRCVPEIIRFSNDLCYHSKLVALRQYPPERLEPIVVRHITEGFREGGTGYARNKPEAEALVEAIVQCTKDPRYLCAKDDHHPNGKLTFGVISLQGEEQAKLINQLLLERLPPEEIEQRELVCGDAYAFQGDERDVIFLSMVAASNQRIGPLTRPADMQRFNVSASRARDQVWLFHTVTLNELIPTDMRYKLLAYYSNPAAQPAGKPDWEKCESEFEREVGKIIYAKGFRLIPQYEPFGPGSYRIDFVIEGLKSRLAVEVDGPHHDDPEQIGSDMARQRQLERCKWVFWRVSASNFYFDREKAMASLWHRLEELGIYPQAATPTTAPPQTPPQAELTTLPLPPAPLGSPPTITVETNSVASIPTPPVPHRPPRRVPRDPFSSRQPDLIPSSQMELPTQATEVQADRLVPRQSFGVLPIAASLREYAANVKLRRAHGIMTIEEIGHVVMELLPQHNRILPQRSRTDRKELIKTVANVLEFPEVAFKRIDEAIRRLEELEKVCADSDSVWRSKP